MNIQEEYKSKLKSAEEAVKLVESGESWFVGPATATPAYTMNALCDRYEELEGVGFCGTNIGAPIPFLMDPKFKGHIEYCTYFTRPPLERPMANKGMIEYASVCFTKTKYFLQEVRKVTGMITGASEMDEEGYMWFGPQGASVNGMVSEMCNKIIIQVNKKMPKIPGNFAKIHISQVDAIVEMDYDIIEFPENEITEREQTIANHILPYIRDNSTIQVGIGGLAQAVSYGLDKRKNLVVYTEMLTPSMKYLDDVGALDPNQQMTVGFVLGKHELNDWAANSGRVFIQQNYKTGQVAAIAAHDDFVSINGCLLVDLTGQVASEGIGSKTLAGMGGSSAFVRGAALSDGGQSFICLPSTAEIDGKVTSNIVFGFPIATPVTVNRSDVMNIVTEYGVANIYTKSVRERAKALISIAHPDFREELTAQAKKAYFI